MEGVAAKLLAVASNADGVVMDDEAANDQDNVGVPPAEGDDDGGFCGTDCVAGA